MVRQIDSAVKHCYNWLSASQAQNYGNRCVVSGDTLGLHPDLIDNVADKNNGTKQSWSFQCHFDSRAVRSAADYECERLHRKSTE